MNSQQQRMAAIGTDKELSDLLDFSAVGYSLRSCRDFSVVARTEEQGQQRAGLGWVCLSQVGHLNFDVMSRLPDLIL